MKPSFLCALGATCLLIGAAHADLKWTETMKLDGGPNAPAGMGGFTIQTTRYMNAEASRTDTTSKIGPMTMQSREIDLCPTQKTLSLFDEGKLYSEEPLRPPSLMPGMPSMPGMRGMPGGGQDTNKPKRTGTQTVSFQLRDLGTEKILDVDTKHYALDTTVVATGCAGNGTTKTSIEVWKADFPMPAPCLTPTFEGTIKNSGRIASDCDVKTTVEGNAESAANVFSGFLMRLKFSMGPGSMTREVTMLSRAALENDVFQIPADYRKVSTEELEKARQAAMMKAMMNGMAGGGMPPMPAGDD